MRRASCLLALPALAACDRVRTEDFSFAVGEAWVVECPDGNGAMALAHSVAKDDACFVDDVPEDFEPTTFDDCDDLNETMDALYAFDGSCGAFLTVGWKAGLIAYFASDGLEVRDDRVVEGTSSGVRAIHCDESTGEFDVGTWFSGVPAFEGGNATFRRHGDHARVRLSGFTDVSGQIAIEGGFGAHYCERSGLE